jgi:site-specific DNA recombinase
MKQAYGYIRVSTEQQADSGLSLEAQRTKVTAMAVVQGVELAGIITDEGESAKSLNRPGMEKLLGMIDGGQVSTVIIAKLDRLSRSVKDFGSLIETFEKKGVNLVSVADSLDTKTAGGRLVLNVLMSVFQWEREAIAERTKDAMAVLRKSGKRAGTVPFGSQLAADGVQLEAAPAEKAIIARIKGLREEGFSLRDIADELNRQGFTTRKGTAWKHNYIYNILKAA